MERTLNDDQVARLPTPNQANLIGKLDVGALPVFMGAPALADDNLIVTTHDIVAGGMTIAAQPEVPRNLTFVLTDADDSVTATIVIVGLDPAGRAVTETAQITLGTGKAWTGVKMYAVVSSITVSALSGEAGGDAIIVGTGNVIALPFDIDDTDAVKAVYYGGAKVTPAALASGVSESGIDCNDATYDGTKLMHAMVQPHFRG